jgi:DNA-binding CsgD family transcriptional regulator/PAS domain-containing protein
MLAQDSRFELAHAMLKALRDEEGCAPFVDRVVHVLRVDRFWAFCVDSERAALLWEARAGDSVHPDDRYGVGVQISFAACAAPDWMLKLCASSDRASPQVVNVDRASTVGPSGPWDSWVVRQADDGRVICVSSARHPNEPLRSADIPALGDAGILLEEVFALRARMRSDRQQTMGLTAMAQASTFGVALLDDDGGIQFVNNAARAILAAGDGLINKSGKLAGLRARENRLLAALLREGAAGAADVVEIERRLGAKSYGVIHVAAVASASGHRTHGILINDPEQPLVISAARVQQLFGLTVAESMIAARCATGLEPHALARELGITRSTVRTHLRSIFRKTGVKRQVDLVILLLRSVAAAVTPRGPEASPEAIEPIANRPN